MYAVVWKYRIEPTYRKEFEHEYGSTGSWYSLFRASVHYKGSALHKSDNEPNVYLLIDRWLDKTSYEAFKNETGRLMIG